jgi:hypothetical protein
MLYMLFLLCDWGLVRHRLSSLGLLNVYTDFSEMLGYIPSGRESTCKLGHVSWGINHHHAFQYEVY